MSEVFGSGPIGRAAEALSGRVPEAPRVLTVLGSGLGGLAEGLDDAVEIPFDAVPGYPRIGVEGHDGRYVWGRIDGEPVLMQAGRFHLYEGHHPSIVAAPVRVASVLGVRTVVLTNAAGGIHRFLRPGSIMLLDDHINLTWRNPLTGPVLEGEVRFPDMSAPYDAELQRVAIETAADERIPLHRGTYVAVAGPSYETPAEIRMLERLGADAVGMSTVPEVIAARARGMRCLAFSMITNRAAGLSGGPLDHEEVIEVGRRAGSTLQRLVRSVLRRVVGAPDPTV